MLEDYFLANGQFTSMLWYYFQITWEIKEGAKDGFAKGMPPKQCIFHFIDPELNGVANAEQSRQLDWHPDGGRRGCV